MLALAESWDSWRLYGTLAAAQGRYMFVGLAGASAVVASGVQHAWPRKLPPQATLLTLALALQASSAVQAAGWWYSTPGSSTLSRFTGQLTLPPAAVVMAAALSTILMVVSCGRIARSRAVAATAA